MTQIVDGAMPLRTVLGGGEWVLDKMVEGGIRRPRSESGATAGPGLNAGGGGELVQVRWLP